VEEGEGEEEEEAEEAEEDGEEQERSSNMCRVAVQSPVAVASKTCTGVTSTVAVALIYQG
jgi:hypothetical protein